MTGHERFQSLRKYSTCSIIVCNMTEHYFYIIAVFHAAMDEECNNTVIVRCNLGRTIVVYDPSRRSFYHCLIAIVSFREGVRDKKTKIGNLKIIIID